jgi:hypothetical protein
VEQVFSRVRQLSEINLDPDALADMVSIMVNKFVYKPSVKDAERMYDGYSTHTLSMREYVLIHIIYSLHLYNEGTHK